MSGCAGAYGLQYDSQQQHASTFHVRWIAPPSPGFMACMPAEARVKDGARELCCELACRSSTSGVGLDAAALPPAPNTPPPALERPATEGARGGVAGTMAGEAEALVGAEARVKSDSFKADDEDASVCTQASRGCMHSKRGTELQGTYSTTQLRQPTTTQPWNLHPPPHYIIHELRCSF